MHYPVIIIGGGVTGIGILRDLSMRGIKALLVEQGDLANGASSRFHGLLHSGARYVAGDLESAKECIEENTLLRNIAPHSLEITEGFFVRTPDDPVEYEEKWLEGCDKAGISAKPISVKEARALEPNLADNILSVYRVPDSAVDGFRLIWQNALSARRYGGEFRNYTEVKKINIANGAVTGVTTYNKINNIEEYITCDYIINASGAWAGKITRMAGIDINVTPNRGLLLAFNHRFTDHVINRLRKSGNADIFVPHGSITILGTTSVNVDDPADKSVLFSECMEMLEVGKILFPNIMDYRLLRGFTGTRPLYTPNSSSGRDVSRSFAVLDHEADGLKGFASIVGGKFTTYRLMAEKTCDVVAAKLGNSKQCRTAEEPLVPELSKELTLKAKKYFPAKGINLTISRHPDKFEDIVKTMEKEPEKKILLCECELVTRAEFETAANDPACKTIGDLRRRTRMGMGTCQGTFCAYRSVGAMCQSGIHSDKNPAQMLKDFTEERWRGIRPMIWGTQIREVELNRGIYATLLNTNGVNDEV